MIERPSEHLARFGRKACVIVRDVKDDLIIHWNTSAAAKEAYVRSFYKWHPRPALSIVAVLVFFA